jgi:hypothetical protein
VDLAEAESLVRQLAPGHVLTAADLEALRVVRERDRTRWLAGVLGCAAAEGGRRGGRVSTGSGA